MELEFSGNEVNKTGLVENNSLSSAESVNRIQNILRRIAFISITLQKDNKDYRYIYF